MKCIAALAIDLAQSPLGTRSQLAEPLCGTPILRRTLDRLTRAKRIKRAIDAFPIYQNVVFLWPCMCRPPTLGWQTGKYCCSA